MNTITLYNTKTTTLKELENELGIESSAFMIDMTDKYIVYQNDVGFKIMTEDDVISYAQNLIDANPDMWEGHTYQNHRIDCMVAATAIIGNTLDNERVIDFESEV